MKNEHAERLQHHAERLRYHSTSSACTEEYRAALLAGAAALEAMERADCMPDEASTLLSGVRWPSNEMRSQIVPVVQELCESVRLLRDKIDTHLTPRRITSDPATWPEEGQYVLGWCPETVGSHGAWIATCADESGKVQSVFTHWLPLPPGVESPLE